MFWLPGHIKGIGNPGPDVKQYSFLRKCLLAGSCRCMWYAMQVCSTDFLVVARGLNSCGAQAWLVSQKGIESLCPALQGR